MIELEGNAGTRNLIESWRFPPSKKIDAYGAYTYTHRHLHHPSLPPIQIWAINDSGSTCNCHLQGRGGGGFQLTRDLSKSCGTVEPFPIDMPYPIDILHPSFLFGIFHHILSLTFALASASFPWLWLAPWMLRLLRSVSADWWYQRGVFLYIFGCARQPSVFPFHFSSLLFRPPSAFTSHIVSRGGPPLSTTEWLWASAMQMNVLNQEGYVHPTLYY
jgi:hypothetical protein